MIRAFLEAQLFNILCLVFFGACGAGAVFFAPIIASLFGWAENEDAVMYVSLAVFMVLFVGFGTAYLLYPSRAPKK